ncbi:hypothetical protein [Polaribacter sp. Hel_I_88]|uniref:hypothetical protein n=1 Tax=Polaribacter sp. Hel_I_88 TaxID=1250006 RepID=UPI000479FB22|nr:hypothetical protein [Polaribacter sp. Hel_I_88]
MKIKTLILVAILTFGVNQLNAQKIEESSTNEGLHIVKKIKHPKTKKQAILGIRVLNRHKAKFYHNKKEIKFKEAIKLVKKDFDNLLIKEDWENEKIYFTNNVLN